MFETIKNGFNEGIKTIKNLDFGSAGKLVSGGLMLAGALVLLVAGSNAVDVDAFEPVEAMEDVVETDETADENEK